MTLRQLWVRIKALPPEVPLWRLFERDREEAEASSAVDDAIAMMREG